MRPTVAIFNASHAMADADAATIVGALQVQVDRDYAAWYGGSATLRFVPFGTDPPADAWGLGLFDNSDQPGALGYHDVTKGGLPLGKAFVGTDLQYGYKPSVTISHELLEMLADPAINTTVFVQSSAVHGRLYAYEICDAVEADALGYEIDGVLVSDFVTPHWFASFHGQQYSFKGNVHAPFQLAPGGYIGIYDVWGRGWRQETASSQTAAALSTVPTAD